MTNPDDITSITAGNRMTNWRFIGFVVVMAGTLFGTLHWSTGVMERRIDQFERSVNSRFELMEKNNQERADEIKQRFDDLKQVVLSKR